MKAPPCVVYEDDHLLVVVKPPGWNSHTPSPYSGEGIYEWLRDREPRWQSLALVHRLDKETSGVMVFGRTREANRSLTEQFARGVVQKRYLLLSASPLPASELRVEAPLIRAGARYVVSPDGENAVTLFSAAGDVAGSGASRCHVIRAQPLTGRTHQIRVHAAARGFPILGDTLYGGAPAQRLCLHAESLGFRHPESDEPVTFSVPADFDTNARHLLRAAFIDPSETTAWRLIHGDADRWPGWRVDRLGDWLLAQSEAELPAALRRELEAEGARGLYYKGLSRQVGRMTVDDASPQLVTGRPVPEGFHVRENGVSFRLKLDEGYSVGLFLDQRDNRRRFLTGHVAGGFALYPEGEQSEPPALLNAFAYSCGLSVCAALAGARVTSLDLSRKYLDWGRENFTLNGIDPAGHDFIYGDAFDWLRRLGKKDRRFDVLALDPPTFSRSKTSGLFQAEHDYHKLVAAALPLLREGGVLFASSNAAKLKPDDFLAQVRSAIHGAGRSITAEHYAPQPPDFPVSRAEPAYLKTVWMRVG